MSKNKEAKLKKQIAKMAEDTNKKISALKQTKENNENDNAMRAIIDLVEKEKQNELQNYRHLLSVLKGEYNVENA